VRYSADAIDDAGDFAGRVDDRRRQSAELGDDRRPPTGARHAGHHQQHRGRIVRAHLRVQARPEHLPVATAREPPCKTLADIIAFNTAHAGVALKFGQVLALAAQAKDLSPGSADTVKYLADRAQDLTASKARIDASPRCCSPTAAAPPSAPRPVTHRSPSPPATRPATGAVSTSRSSARHGANPPWSATRMPTSRPPSCANHPPRSTRPCSDWRYAGNHAATAEPDTRLRPAPAHTANYPRPARSRTTDTSACSGPVCTWRRLGGACRPVLTRTYRPPIEPGHAKGYSPRPFSRRSETVGEGP
jgi:hypothetical protein